MSDISVVSRHVKMKDTLQALGKKIYAYQVDSSVDVFVATCINSRLVPFHYVHILSLTFGLTQISELPPHTHRNFFPLSNLVFSSMPMAGLLCDMRSVTVRTKPAIGSRSSLLLRFGEGWRGDYSWVRGLCVLRISLYLPRNYIQENLKFSELNTSLDVATSKPLITLDQM
ncbi:hypothetical protein BDQ17DRAFT_1328540 [Cyathus striatus]|nr:hypothetical protein BDQ17DRAFT_1328540 [Cyathus striatus]